MAHGTYKPRAKHLNDVLRSKKGGAHESHSGRAVKRARVNAANSAEVRAELREFGLRG